MPIFAENSSTKEPQKINPRKPRNHFSPQLQQPTISIQTDPNPPCLKPSISSLFLTVTESSSSSSSSALAKKKGAAFRGLGCAAAAAARQVSVPAAIRSAAEWEGKRVKKKKDTQMQKRKKEVINEAGSGSGEGNNGNCMVIQDVWCGPGIGFSSADDVVGSVDCVVSRRKINLREREREPPFVLRRAAVNPETLSFRDSDPALLTSRPEPEVFGSRYYRHVRNPSPDGLAEIMMLRNSFMMGGRLDQFSGWRLDIDHMSYEQLLELSDRIGYVSTGLKDNEICHCIRKIKLPFVNDQSSHLPTIIDKKCTICQEEYEADDELGKLECGHGFHIQCIKQWLAHKNVCPVCKTAPVARGSS